MSKVENFRGSSVKNFAFSLSFFFFIFFFGDPLLRRNVVKAWPWHESYIINQRTINIIYNITQILPTQNWMIKMSKFRNDPQTFINVAYNIYCPILDAYLGENKGQILRSSFFYLYSLKWKTCRPPMSVKPITQQNFPIRILRIILSLKISNWDYMKTFEKTCTRMHVH